MPLMPALLVCCVVAWMQLAGRGEAMCVDCQFLMAFPEQVLNSTRLFLLLANPGTRDVIVNISAPLAGDVMAARSVRLAGGAAAVEEVPDSLMLTGTGVFNKSLLLQSEAPVSVQALSSCNLTKYLSAGAFLPLPVDAWPTSGSWEFWVVTRCQSHSCFLVVAALHFRTRLRITLRIDATSVLPFRGIAYGNGDVISITLQAYQVVQLMAGRDMTGTRVRADHQVAVLVGADFTPLEPGGQADFLVENMPPSHAWGRHYAVLPALDNAVEEVVVVAIEANTSLSLGTQQRWLLAEGQSTTFLPRQGPALLTSDKPLVVGLLGRGSLSLLPPLGPGPPQVTWFVPENYSATLRMTVDVACLSDLALNSRRVSTWNLLWVSGLPAPTGLAWMLLPLASGHVSTLTGTQQCQHFSALLQLSSPHSGAALPLTWPPAKVAVAQSLYWSEIEPSSSESTVDLRPISTGSVGPIAPTMTETPVLSSWSSRPSPSAFNTWSSIVTTTTSSRTPTTTMPRPTAVVEATPPRPSKLCACAFPMRGQGGSRAMSSHVSSLVSSLVSNLVSSLTLNVTALSATKRRRLSTADFRLSASGIGVASVGVVSLVALLILLPDLLQAAVHLARVLPRVHRSQAGSQ